MPIWFLISRFYSGYSGSISIDGVDINDYKLQHLRNSIAIVTQKPNLFNDTLERNIAYGEANIDADRLKFAAEKAGCKSFIDKLPGGYKTYIGDDGVLLSGGQRQRLAIARAFYKDAPIIILDEATSALDTESESLIQSSIDELTKGKTTIIIAHRLSTIEKANKIIVIDEGVIAEQGTHKELIESNGLYQQLYKNINTSFAPNIPLKPATPKYMPDFLFERSLLTDNRYKKFAFKLVSCPFCLGFWLAIVASFGIGNILTAAPIYIISLLLLLQIKKMI